MCNCVKEMNGKLAEYKTELVTNLFGEPKRVCVETYSTADNRRGMKRIPKVIASHCPFCGEKYAKAQSPDAGAA